MRAIITGGPGAGCTSTAARVAAVLGVGHFDSDAYFHKPTDPPYQEQFSAEERRELLGRDLQVGDSWIISGSIATWGLPELGLTHGVVLAVGAAVRLERLAQRERARFAARIEVGGDMRDEHESFMAWAGGYETRNDRGRNLPTDQEFVCAHSQSSLVIREALGFEETCDVVRQFLAKAPTGFPAQ
jgi:adenylate kinase family enzyme